VKSYKVEDAVISILITNEIREIDGNEDKSKERKTIARLKRVFVITLILSCIAYIIRLFPLGCY